MVFRLGGHFLAAATLIATVILANPALAQSLPTPVVAVLDMQSILQKSQAAQSVRQQRDSYLQSYQNEFTKEEGALRQAEQDLANQRSLLAPDAFADKRRAFEQQVAAFQRKVQERRAALERSFAQAMGQIQQSLIKITDDLAEEKGANLVLFRSQVFLFDPKMDITELALQRLDQTLPTVTFPQPAAESNQ